MGFLDPLDVEFYEDIWYEHARRNGDLPEEFHPQPDNRVNILKRLQEVSETSESIVLTQQHESFSQKKAKARQYDALGWESRST